MDANTLRRLNWLWKHRHSHEGDDVEERLTIIESTVSNQGATAVESGTGATVHLLAEPQSVASGGAAVVWASTHTIPAFEFSVEPPVSSVVIPKDGYYNVDVELGWDSWVDGGSVSVVRSRTDGEGVTTDETVWPPLSTPGLWLSDEGRRFEGTAPAIPCESGDLLAVYVDHQDDDAQTLAYGSVGVYLVDRGAGVPPEPEPENVFVFTTSGTFDWEAAGSPSTLADVWIIGGGAGGSKRANDNWRGGGGGAGGVLHLEDYAISGNVAVVVGYGGAGGTGPTDELKNGGYGGPSSFDGQVAAGGGFGAIGGSSQGASGGCGGGGGAVGALTRNGGAGSQGGDGGDGGSGHAGGGGGGAGGNGADGASGVGGNGGAGIDLSSVVGTDYGEAGWFAGGGGGTGASSNGTGSAGGGDGTGQHALANTGGGGGAGPNTGGGNGGTGIVIVKVAD